MKQKQDCKSPARSVQKPRKAAPARTGTMKPGEIKPLAILAKKAFQFQLDLGNIEDGTDEKAWRHEEVKKAVGKDGLTALHSNDFRPVKAHFQLLCGEDDKAFETHMRSGKQRSQDAPDDTRENRDQLAYLIREALDVHLSNALDPVVVSNGGPIRAGYALFLARKKFRKPSLSSLDELAERLTIEQLHQLLSTIKNRISTREGRADPDRRKSRRKQPA